MNKLKKEIYFFEGLPGSGKTMFLEKLKSKGVAIVPEVINSEKLPKYHNKSDQSFFFNNDELKLKMAEKMNGTILVDRSPLSTLFFNLAKFLIDQRANPALVFQWYTNNFGKKFRNDPKFHFFFIDITSGLSIKRSGARISKKDPWTNLKSLQFIRNLYFAFGENYLKNFEVINGDDDLEIILSKISRKIHKNYD